MVTFEQAHNKVVCLVRGTISSGRGTENAEEMLAIHEIARRSLWLEVCVEIEVKGQ